MKCSYKIRTGEGTAEWIAVEHGPNPSVGEIAELLGRGMDVQILDYADGIVEMKIRRTGKNKDWARFRSNAETDAIIAASEASEERNGR